MKGLPQLGQFVAMDADSSATATKPPQREQETGIES
jgi:hypothetical protein